MHLRIELVDESRVAGSVACRQILKIKREAAINRKSRKELKNLLAKYGPALRIVEQVAHTAVPDLSSGVVIVEMREDFGIFFCKADRTLDAVQIIGVVN